MYQFLLGCISLLFLSALFVCLVMFLKKYEKRNVVFEIIVTVIVVQVFKWAFIDITRVPSSSMEKTLIPGDFVLVNKFYYGVRTPSTILQIPLTHQKTKLFEIKSYLDWIQIPFFRFPGFAKIRTNDVVVFNTPYESDLPMDMRLLYVKRCIGLPGDRIKMVEGKYFVNGKRVVDAPNKVYEFVLKSNSILSKKWFKVHKVDHYEYYGDVESGIRIYLVGILAKNVVKTVSKIRSNGHVVSIELRRFPVDNDAFVAKFDGCNDMINWGGEEGILVPKKGLKIILNKVNIDRYWKYISQENGRVKLVDGCVYLNDKKIDEYEFVYDYYFMIGDNIFNSFDSRNWGFVRADEIYAKPIITLFSKSMDSLFSGVKFRCLKGMW